MEADRMSAQPEEKGIDSVLKERRTFPPPSDFAARARVGSLAEYERIYRRSVEDPDGFWAEVAEGIAWERRWDRVREGRLPYVKWFTGGTLNASVSCLDRHLGTARAEKTALIWIGEPGEQRRITYAELHAEVCRAANALRALGVKKGDRVGIYLPMIPELAIALLACARIGAIHSVVFGGFSADALRDRVNDAQAVLLVTADRGLRRRQVGPLEQLAGQAPREAPPAKDGLIVPRPA